jgi:hypothetical protein
MVQLWKEQNKYDQIPSVIFDRLQRVLPFANKVADEIVCEETDLLEKIIPRMFEVMNRVARFSCDYVKRSRLSLLIWELLIILPASKNGWWAFPPGNGRRNGQRVGQGDRGI